MQSSSNSVIFIDAYNLKSGGGETVLKRIIEVLIETNRNFIVVSNVKELESIGELRLVKSLVERDLFLYRKSIVLYLSNIPPIFKIRRSRSVYYLHQRYWIDYRGYTYMKTVKAKLLYTLKLIYWNVFKYNVRNIVVQTDDMRNLLPLTWFQKEVQVMPVFKEVSICVKEKINACLIIGDNSPHKNSHNLDDILRLFNDLSIQYKYIGYTNAFDSDGSRSKWYPKSEYWDLLCSHKFVIISSDFESLGLPFIEAAQAGCIVIVPKKFPLLEELVSMSYTIVEFREMLLMNARFDRANLVLKDRTLDLLEFCEVFD